MTDEKELYAVGEKLAELAVENRVASGALRRILQIAHRNPVPFLKASVLRDAQRLNWGRFADEAVKCIDKYQDNVSDVRRAFMYAYMLYDYKGEQRQMEIGRKREQRRVEIDRKFEELVKSKVAEYGFKGVTVSEEGMTVRVNVQIRDFPKNVREISAALEGVIGRLPEYSGRRVKVWFETERR